MVAVSPGRAKPSHTHRGVGSALATWRPTESTHTYAVAAIEALLDQRYPARTGWAVLGGAPPVGTVVVEAVLALWVAQRGFRYDRRCGRRLRGHRPEGFASLLDFAVALEEHRLRVGWSGSDGSDGFDEDR